MKCSEAETAAVAGVFAAKPMTREDVTEMIRGARAQGAGHETEKSAVYRADMTRSPRNDAAEETLPPGAHADDVEDDAPPTTWRELMIERERAVDRYRALKRRLLEER